MDDKEPLLRVFHLKNKLLQLLQQSATDCNKKNTNCYTLKFYIRVNNSSIGATKCNNFLPKLKKLILHI